MFDLAQPCLRARKIKKYENSTNVSLVYVNSKKPFYIVIFFVFQHLYVNF